MISRSVAFSTSDATAATTIDDLKPSPLIVQIIAGVRGAFVKLKGLRNEKRAFSARFLEPRGR